MRSWCLGSRSIKLVRSRLVGGIRVARATATGDRPALIVNELTVFMQSKAELEVGRVEWQGLGAHGHGHGRTHQRTNNHALACLSCLSLVSAAMAKLPEQGRGEPPGTHVRQAPQEAGPVALVSSS